MAKLTSRDLAARLGVTQRTIDRWRRVGYIPAPIPSPAKRGAVWEESDIVAWEQRGYGESAPSLELARIEDDEHTRLGIEALVDDAEWTADVDTTPEQQTAIQLIRQVVLPDGDTRPAGKIVSPIDVSVATKLVSRGFARLLIDPRWVLAPKKKENSNE